MKKVFVPILLALLFVTAVSMAESAFLDAAKAMLPEGARLVESDRDDGLYEYEFTDGHVRYDVVLGSAGEKVALKRDWTQVKAAAANAMDTAAASQKALALLQAEHPDAAVVLAIPEKDDGRWVWKVYLKGSEDLFEVELNAETGEMKECEQYFGAVVQAVSPDSLWNQLKSSKGAEELAKLDLEHDDGRLVYTGTATVNAARYEFEALAKDGSLREWERD